MSKKVNCWPEILGQKITEIKSEDNGALIIWFEDRWIEIESTDPHQFVELYQLVGEPAFSEEVQTAPILEKMVVKVVVPYNMEGTLQDALVSVYLEDGSGFRIGSEAHYYPIRIS